MSTGTTFRIALGGTAVVCCVHDREKRQLTSLGALASLAAATNSPFNEKRDRVFLCACCENLFTNPGDEPLYCHACRTRALVHELGGPLEPATGPVN